MTGIAPATAQAGVAGLYADPNFKLIGAGDDAFIAFGYSTANKNPLYAEASSTTLGSTQNLVGSRTCIDSMNNNGDPRLYAFYEPLSNGSFAGITQGAYSTAALTSTFSIPTVYVGGDAGNSASGNAPVNLLTSYESLFLQAEVVARGWEASSFGYIDDSLFYHGINANFVYYASAFTKTYGAPYTSTIDSDYLIGYLNGGVVGSPLPGYWAVYPTAGTVQQKLRFIITQKWFAMCGNQGFEAWCEQRRTGYPDFFVVSVNSLVGANLPKRFLYPTSESTRNFNFPGVAPITAKMWWDLY